MHILGGMVKMLWKISKVPFEISRKIFEAMHIKIYILRGVNNLAISDILESWHIKCKWDRPLRYFSETHWAAANEYVMASRRHTV